MEERYVIFLLKVIQNYFTADIFVTKLKFYIIMYELKIYNFDKKVGCNNIYRCFSQ